MCGAIAMIHKYQLASVCRLMTILYSFGSVRRKFYLTKINYITLALRPWSENVAEK